jgi:SOS-response transcriptional repressor LexA
MTQKEFSASLGIVQGFLCSIERGKKSPSDTLLIALQHLYGINPEWLENGSGDMFTRMSSAASGTESPVIPLYKSPPVSLDSISAATVKEFISVPGITADCFAFEYTGDFMAPTIRDGDIVIIKPAMQPVAGDIVLIVGHWGDSFLRRYRRRGDEVFCSADNSSYSPFKPDANTKVIGTVHAVWRKIKI